MTDNIEYLEGRAGSQEIKYMPYIQAMATLELARQQRETNEQLTRIADALQRPARPDLREMTRNSLPDVPHRNEVIEQAVKPFIEPPELHDCIRSVAPADRGWAVCDPCTTSKFCKDKIPF